MQQTTLFKVPGKPSTRPLVILTGLDIEAKSSTSIRMRLSRALSKARQWTRCNRTPVRAISAMFAARVSAVVGIMATAAMWLAIFTAADDAAAQSAVGRICLAALPWAAVWTVRACRMPLPSAQEGGEA